MTVISQQDQIAGMSRDIKDIKVALLGNPEFKTKGFVHNIEDIQIKQLSQQMEITGNHRHLEERIDQATSSLESRMELIERGEFKKKVVMVTISSTAGAASGVLGWIAAKPALAKFLFMIGFLK